MDSSGFGTVVRALSPSAFGTTYRNPITTYRFLLTTYKYLLSTYGWFHAKLQIRGRDQLCPDVSRGHASKASVISEDAVCPPAVTGREVASQSPVSMTS